MFNKYYQKRRTALTLAIIMVLALFAPIAEHTVLAESTYGSSAYEHIEYLSEKLSEPRVTGSAGEVEASEYIKSQFESYGYKTSVQKFSYKRGEKTTIPKILLP